MPSPFYQADFGWAVVSWSPLLDFKGLLKKLKKKLKTWLTNSFNLKLERKMNGVFVSVQLSPLSSVLCCCPVCYHCELAGQSDQSMNIKHYCIRQTGVVSSVNYKRNIGDEENGKLFLIKLVSEDIVFS